VLNINILNKKLNRIKKKAKKIIIDSSIFYFLKNLDKCQLIDGENKIFKSAMLLLNAVYSNKKSAD